MGAILDNLVGLGRAMAGARRDQIGLAWRSLETLPWWVAHCQGARALSLHGNRLRELPPSLGALGGLESLDITSNPFDEFPRAVFALSALRELSFSATMRELPDEFDALHKLESVRIVNEDRLRALPPSFGRLRSLRSLELCGQASIELGDHLAGLTSLESLKFSRVAVGALPAVITRLPSLKSLYLYNCDLTALPDAIGDLGTLEELITIENPLGALPASMARLQSLRRLVVHKAPLRSLPAALGRLERLEKLELDTETPADPEELMAIWATVPRCQVVGGTRPSFAHHAPGHVTRPNTRKTEFCFSYGATASLKQLCALLWIDHEDDLYPPLDRRSPLPVARLPDWGALAGGASLIAAAFEAHPLTLQLEPLPPAFASALDGLPPDEAARLALRSLWFAGLERVASASIEAHAAHATESEAPPSWLAPLCLAGALGVDLATLPSAGRDSGPSFYPQSHGLAPAPPYPGGKNALHDGQPSGPALLEYDRTLKEYLREVAAYLERLADGPLEPLAAAVAPRPWPSANPMRERLRKLGAAALGQTEAASGD